LVPVAGILVSRRMSLPLSSSVNKGRERGRGRFATWCPALGGLLITLLLAQADANQARAQRDAARDLSAKYSRADHALWFEGHWGFQYYMEKLGARPLDMVHPAAKPGDFILIPNAGTFVSQPDPAAAALVGSTNYLPNNYWATMEPSVGAGFYNAYRGPLPFAAGKIKPEYYWVFAAKP